MSDASIVLRDIAGDASQNAANRLRPSEEQLASVDQPAEENVWHEKPDTEQLKSRVKSATKKSKAGVSPSSSRTLHSLLTPTKTDESASDVTSTAAQAAGGKRSKKAGAQAGAEKTKESIQEKVPEESKNQTSELAGKTKNYLSDKFPQERRDLGITRLKKMVVEVQGHPDCKSCWPRDQHRQRILD